MNPYNFAVLFFSFSTFLLALLVWLRRQDNLSVIYFVFSVFASLWGIGYAIMISQNTSYEVALLATRLSQGTSLFIPITWLHFILSFVDRVEKNKALLFFLYILSLLVSGFVLSPWFIPKLEPAVGFNFYTRPGPLYHIYTLLYFLVVPLGFIELVKKAKNASKEEKIQLKGFFIATLFGFFGGSFCFLPVYEIMIPQYGLFFMPIYPFVIAYFMTRHRLFDVEQAIQSFQREKLATIGLLAASVNHEIRNPLYVAKSTLESNMEREKNRDSLEACKKTLSSINRALDVITKLNRFAKPAPDSISSDQTASIQAALQTVLDLISYEFKSDKIKIDNQIPNDLPLVQADQRQLEEILFNLIVNACHAMTGKGDRQEVLPVPFSVLTLRSTIHDSRITIEIKDTGTGISSDHMKHLFEPFHTTKGENGTGLGLYITKQLVERNGGKISVKSEEGEGTLFVLGFKRCIS